MLLNDGVRAHPKILRAGPEAAWLWVASIDYCREQLTDGVIPLEALATLAAFRVKPRALAQRLVDVGLFEPVEGGYRIHDFLAHNDSADVVREKRRQAARRKADWRARVHATSPESPEAVSVTSSACPDDVPLGQERDSTVTRAQAYPRVGVGTGTGTSDRTGDLSTSDARARDAAPEEGAGLSPERQLWTLYRATATEVGCQLPLEPSPKDFEHLAVLSRSYALDRLRPALQCWWASPHIPRRYLGQFRADVADVLTHLASESSGAFRAPEARRQAEPSPRSGPWRARCPHVPPCSTPTQCALQNAREARGAA